MVGRSVGSRIFLASSSSAYLSIHLSYCPSRPASARPSYSGSRRRNKWFKSSTSVRPPPTSTDSPPPPPIYPVSACLSPLLACLIRQENMAELLACHTSPPPRLDDGLRNPRLCGLLRRRVRSGWGREIDRRIGWDGRRGERERVHKSSLFVSLSGFMM